MINIILMCASLLSVLVLIFIIVYCSYKMYLCRAQERREQKLFSQLSQAHINWSSDKEDDYKWYKTTCSCCGREFEVKISEKRYKENPLLTAGCTCFKCIPENSCARNGMDADCYEHKE